MENEPRDIIENLEMMAPPETGAWIFSMSVLFGLLLVLGLILWIGYRKRKLPFQQPVPDPPDVIALRELQKIKPLVESDDDRTFVVELSRILRYYIEGRFTIRAPHLSTEEFLYLAGQSESLNADQQEGLARFLSQCDRVKFALGRLERPAYSSLFEAAESFVLQTRAQISADDKEPPTR